MSWYNDIKNDDLYWQESAKIDFAVNLDRRCQEKGISRSQLAEKIGKSPAYITKILRGDTNLTIDSMVKLIRAIGGELHIEIRDQPSEKPKTGSWNNITDINVFKNTRQISGQSVTAASVTTEPRYQNTEKAA